MKSIQGLFLRAKHWQVFAFLVGGGIVCDVFPTAYMSPALFDSSITKFLMINVLFMAPFIAFFFGWLWSMGSFLSSVTDPRLRLKMNFFGFALIFPIPYTFTFMIVVSQNPQPWIVLLILPFHFLAMFCMFYILYFLSKSLVMVETGKRATFYEYAGPFFLFWFFPIGVWFTQPRINQLYAKRRDIAITQEPVTS